VAARAAASSKVLASAARQSVDIALLRARFPSIPTAACQLRSAFRNSFRRGFAFVASAARSSARHAAVVLRASRAGKDCPAQAGGKGRRQTQRAPLKPVSCKASHAPPTHASAVQGSPSPSPQAASSVHPCGDGNWVVLVVVAVGTVLVLVVVDSVVVVVVTEGAVVVLVVTDPKVVVVVVPHGARSPPATVGATRRTSPALKAT